MIIGGELKFKYIESILSKGSFLKLEPQKLKVKTSLNLHLVTTRKCNTLLKLFNQRIEKLPIKNR